MALTFALIAEPNSRLFTVTPFTDDGSGLDDLEPKLAAVLAVAGDADTEVLVTATELGVGWGGQAG